MITIPVYIHTICPYCGSTNRLVPDRVPNTNQMVTLCYPEDGGCDKYYAVMIQVNFKCTSYEMKGVRTE